jgi:prepilin-type N-terminal cleavage/methylation domain-containing protein
MRNKGFSLVELIIVIAIIAILAAAIAPALIRYITKSRKADDIAAADAIGVSVNAAISSDDEMTEFINWNVAELKNSSTDNEYRVIGYSSVSNSNQGQAYRSPFRVNNNLPSKYSAIGQQFADFMNEDLGNELVTMRFTSFGKLDQWILCVDRRERLSVWVGADMNGNVWHIKNDGTTGGTQRYYQLWPEIDSDYQMLNNVNDVPG